jgi:hypothetical protein
MRGLAFAQQLHSKNVHVNDVDLDEFTRRRWIGVQR